MYCLQCIMIVQTVFRISEEMPTAGGQLLHEYVKCKHNVFENVIVNNCIYAWDEQSPYADFYF